MEVVAIHQIRCLLQITMIFCAKFYHPRTILSHDTQAVSAQVTEEEGKLQKLRIQLAKRNRDIAALQRKIDNIPTRGELAQYQQVRAV